MDRKHFSTLAEIQRQIEKAHQTQAQATSALILDGLTSAMGLIQRIVARIMTVPARRA